MTLCKLMICSILFYCQLSYSIQMTVSKSGMAQYSTIQSAVDAAHPGDIITITDTAIYEERVVVENKTDLTIQSLNSRPGQFMPAIQWQDNYNVGPQNCDDAKIEEKITYNRNAALLIAKSYNICISGIKVDGKKPSFFAYPGIWNCRDPLFHGNGAITILQSGKVTVRNCEITNAFFGIYTNDSNRGGIFANPNPADLATWSIAPLSNFGQAGNHTIEHSRIHDNSYGLFFEATWDLSSIVRYNLIYENHHTAEISRLVKAAPDGGNQPGGAFLFKDNSLSLLSIYNNTFWHNHVVFCGHWLPGAQHLIFNNIFAQPYILWNKNPDFPNPFQAMDPCYLNRIKSCLYSCQSEKSDTLIQYDSIKIFDPATNDSVVGTSKYQGALRVRIMTNMDQIEKSVVDIPIVVHLSTRDTTVYKKADWVIKPGALITGSIGKPFPKDAEVRWLEMKFKSTDPQSPFFLVPDWNDTNINKFVRNGGYKDAGIFNTDGSIADIGAIPFNTSQNPVQNLIPLAPVYIKDNHAIINFKLDLSSETFPDPKIEYFQLIKNIIYQPTLFGPNQSSTVPLSSIITIPTNIKVTSGVNIVDIQLPSAPDTSDRYGFFEMILSSKNGNTYNNSTGFFPYRNVPSTVKIELLDISTLVPISTVIKGQPVIMKISIPSGITIVTPITIRNLSGEKLLHKDGTDVLFSKRADTYLDTVSFNNEGMGAIVINGQTSDYKIISECSQPFTVALSNGIIHKSITTPSGRIQSGSYNLFSIGGRKIATVSSKQILCITFSHGKQFPSGTYIAIPEILQGQCAMKRIPLKIVVP